LALFNVGITAEILMGKSLFIACKYDMLKYNPTLMVVYLVVPEKSTDQAVASI